MSLINVISQISKGRGLGTVTPPPVTPENEWGLNPNEVWLVVFNGESNSGGYALNTELSAPELAIRSSVRIWNNNTSSFQDLDIGTNNLISHTGLTDNVTHGWENGMAIESEAARLPNPVYLVKTGQGGSLISDWAVGNPVGYWNTMINRVTAAKAAIEALGKVPKIIYWYSLGINDAITGTNVNTWGAAVESFFGTLREVFPNVRVLMTRLMEVEYNSYNLKIDEIIAADPLTHCIPTQDLTKRDTNHWDAAGMKKIAARFRNEMQVKSATFDNAVIVFDGNSLTNSGTPNGYGNGLKYPEVIKLINPFHKNGSVFTNVAVSGQTNQQMIDDAVAQVDSLYNPSKKCIVVAWEIGNDLYFNGDQSLALSRFITYCQARRAAGFKVIAVTPTRRDLGGTTPAGDTWAEYNTMVDNICTQMRSGFSVYADGLADIAADVRLQNPLDTTYYVDGVHHNGAGRVIIAEIVYNEIMKL